VEGGYQIKEVDFGVLIVLLLGERAVKRFKVITYSKALSRSQKAGRSRQEQDRQSLV
jgi:hypothetical protein